MFFNNEKLRGAGETVQMTEEEIKEYIKCRNSIFHFAKYFTIIGPAGEEKMKLRDYQEKIVKVICAKIPEKNNRIIMMGRQTGKTTIATLYILWYALFHKSKNIAVLANKAAQAEEILLRIKNAYTELPMWLQQGLVKWNNGEITMENKTKIFCGASSSSSVRGKSIDLLLVDEFAFLPEEDAKDFIKSVFQTQSARKDAMMILISTPHGMNEFYNIWTKAAAGISSYVAAKIQWWEIPGRDEAWKKRIIRDFGIQMFMQEYACLLGNEKITVKSEEGIELTDTIENLYELYMDGFLR